MLQLGEAWCYAASVASGAAMASLSPAITSPEILLCSLMSAQSVVAPFEAQKHRPQAQQRRQLSQEQGCDR